MTDWADYVRRFYSLSPQQQKSEWERLTDDQRREFEAARARATPASPSASTKLVSANGVVVGCAVMLAVGALLVGSLALLMDLEKRQTQRRAEEEARREAEEAQATIEFFGQNRSQILQKVAELIESDDSQEAIDLTAKYLAVQDPELMELHEKAKAKLETAERRQKIDDLLAEVRQVPAANVVKNRDLYRQLAELDPEEAQYAEKLRFYAQRVQEQVERLRQEQKRDQERREQEEKQRQARVARFGPPPERSSWDGSYRVVQQYLLRVANDPDSIKIDGCTDVYHTVDGWLVGCDYRGRNAFGGMIRQSNWFSVRHGRVVEMHDASAYSP